MKKLLRVNGLDVIYTGADGRRKYAVRRAKMEIAVGETLGLVGESGCGKSSLAKAVMQFINPASGEIYLEDEDLRTLKKKRLKRLRPRFQMIFQDPVSSLNPKRTVGATLLLPANMVASPSVEERIRRVNALLEQVGLSSGIKSRFPSQLSGGQCQRVQIARALMTEPRLLVCDEPVSSLDVSTQAQIVHLLRTLQKTKSLSILFISHDLAVVKRVCDRIAVMYKGTICEDSPNRRLYSSPRHPYTRSLLDAVPSIERKWPEKFLPPQKNDPTGRRNPTACVFEPRCLYAKKLCREVEPELQEIGDDSRVACHFPLPVNTSLHPAPVPLATRQ